MRIGIDAHIILPQHKRYDPAIASYTENLITSLIDADKDQKHTWVLFFDSRMENTKKFERPNVEIKHFPFIQYRTYLPVVYSHMLVSAFLTKAGLDIFHSPEGLIPFVYPGKIITTFHYVPTGESESNLFVRTFIMGARVAFWQLCKRAKRIVVFKDADKKILVERHSYPAERVIVTDETSKKLNWKKHSMAMIELYEDVGRKKKIVSEAKSKAKKSKKKGA